jgi:hypothetical protein
MRQAIRALPDCAMLCWERGKHGTRQVVAVADCDGFPDLAADFYRAGRHMRVMVAERWGYIREPGKGGRTDETQALEAPLVTQSRDDYRAARRAARRA